MSNKTTVTIIGGGQAGLAMSHCLTAAAIDHVVLERGEVANSWRTERWDSLRLLTPNWMTRLPHFRYDGDHPDGYMTAAEVTEFIGSYGPSFGAPIQSQTSVERVRFNDGRGHLVTTNQGDFRSETVVIATGACSTPRIPTLSSALPSTVAQLAPIHYRKP